MRKFLKILFSLLKRLREASFGTVMLLTEKLILLVGRPCVKIDMRRDLNFKDLTRMNEAFLLKIGCGVLTNDKAFWVQVIRGKYGRGSSDFMQVKSCVTDSRLRKVIVSLWPHMISNTRNQIGDGSTTKFWHHAWVDGATKLYSIAANPADVMNNHDKVASFVNQNGYWDFSEMVQHIPTDYINKIKAIIPPSISDDHDSLLWIVYDKLMTALRRSKWSGSSGDCYRCLRSIRICAAHFVRLPKCFIVLD